MGAKYVQEFGPSKQMTLAEVTFQIMETFSVTNNQKYDSNCIVVALVGGQEGFENDPEP